MGTQKHGKGAEVILAAHMTRCTLEPAMTDHAWKGFLSKPTRDTSDDTLAELDNCDTLSDASDVDTQDNVFDTSPRNSLRLLDMIVARHVAA